MILRWAMVTVAAAAMFSVPTMAQAFECPKLFVKAETAIAEAKSNVKDMKGKMAEDALARVRAHINNAEMTLSEAKFHHNKTGGGQHHARAIMRAHMAIGHAAAASALHRSLM
jgi:hypothetical protein